MDNFANRLFAFRGDIQSVCDFFLKQEVVLGEATKSDLFKNLIYELLFVILSYKGTCRGAGIDLIDDEVLRLLDAFLRNKISDESQFNKLI